MPTTSFNLINMRGISYWLENGMDPVRVCDEALRGGVLYYFQTNQLVGCGARTFFHNIQECDFAQVIVLKQIEIVTRVLLKGANSLS